MLQGERKQLGQMNEEGTESLDLASVERAYSYLSFVMVLLCVNVLTNKLGITCTFC